MQSTSSVQAMAPLIDEPIHSVTLNDWAPVPSSPEPTIWRTSPASAICWKKTASLQHADQRERTAARSEIGRSTTSWNTQASGAGEGVMSGVCWNGAVKSTTQWANGRKKKMRKNFGGRSGKQLTRRGSPTTNIKESKNEQSLQSWQSWRFLQCSQFSQFSKFLSSCILFLSS